MKALNFLKNNKAIFFRALLEVLMFAAIPIVLLSAAGGWQNDFNRMVMLLMAFLFAINGISNLQHKNTSRFMQLMLGYDEKWNKIEDDK